MALNFKANLIFYVADFHVKHLVLQPMEKTLKKKIYGEKCFVL